MPQAYDRNRRVLNSSEGIGGLDDAQFVGLAMLMARNWMLRTWILQEVVLSKRVLTLCGSLGFSFDMLLGVQVQLQSLGGLDYKVYNALAKRGLKNRPELTRIPKAWRTLAMIMSCRRKKEVNEKLSFLATVMMSRCSQSTDPRESKVSFR